MRPTKTINRIHFSDLEPLRFEDLCLNIIHRQREWKDIRHYGRKGNDSGIDIFGIDNNDEEWYFQCKRYKSISSQEIENIIVKIKESTKFQLKNLVLFISCDISKKHYEHFIIFAKNQGVENAIVWSASKIETELYKEHHDLLFTYFGLNIPKERTNSVTQLRHSLRMKKRIEKQFIRKDLDIKTITNLIVYEPRCRFNVGEMIIRNIDNNIYPEFDENKQGISDWFKVEIYDLYHNGIEIYLQGSELIIDENGNWDIVEEDNDYRKNKYKSLRVNTVGRIPFSNIMEFDFDGDNYYPMPHLYCKFNIDEMPYESFEYYTYGDSQKEFLPFHFEKNMRKDLK
ncbi:MAG: restriction endonuclease [Prolixibacteraceae bacterium]|nr:restriction endonuclease [Prolixibacteraceae bacterium]